MSKLAIIIPGAGYHTDKPLLYHATKIAVKKGYEIKRLHFEGLPTGIKGDAKKTAQAFEMVMTQACEQLAAIDWKSYEDLVIISKSVGTCVGVNYDLTHPELKFRHVILTPLIQTVTHGAFEGIVFHGTDDDWAPTAELQKHCEEMNAMLHLYPGTGHSLETGDVQKDLDILKNVMMYIEEYL